MDLKVWHRKRQEALVLSHKADLFLEQDENVPQIFDYEEKTCVVEKNSNSGFFLNHHDKKILGVPCAPRFIDYPAHSHPPTHSNTVIVSVDYTISSFDLFQIHWKPCVIILFKFLPFIDIDQVKHQSKR